MRDLRVDRLTVLGGTSGSLGAAVIAATEQVRAATGVDLVGAVRKTPPPLGKGNGG
jgi:hypothetical protein